jgi:protein-disulfide isomerase-like protein with CxxC motif
MEPVKFYFDPRCPWCYQTSRWARRLEELGEIALDWGLFALEVVNLEEGKDPLELEATGSPALRTCVAIADAHGSKAIGPFYAAMGRRQFEAPPPPADPVAAVREALAVAGLDAGLCDTALSDPKTWVEVVDQTRAMIERIGKLGVPAIVLDGGEGPAIFGPVISDMPGDDDAVALWQHTAWLVRHDNFGELKRKRLPQTDLPTVAWYREQRAASERQASQS